MSEFQGKVVIVTGSSSGIGESIARRLADLGATVVVNSSSSVEAGEAVAKSLPNGAIYVRADISKKEEALNLLEQTIKAFGKLDILVNNAGWTTPVPHHDLDALTDEIFLKTFEVNVYGTWYLSKAAIPYLKQSEDGNIVNITSIAGVRQVGSSMAYSMTKAALNQMTKLMAKSCWPVRINAVAPGLIETPWTADWDAMHTNVAKSAPLKRSGTPDDCTEATLGLLRTKYATGQIFVVDGGLTLMS
jgi:ketoreductase RED2